MNNEPVAWMVDGVLLTSLGAALNISFDIEQPCIPLYTHPAKALTEQDLDKLVKDAEESGYMDMYITGLIDGFNNAREILRKAQEK